MKDALKKKCVAVIGAGEIGRAVGGLFPGCDVRYWDVDPAKAGGARIGHALSGASLVFFCVPSWGMRDALEAAVPLMGKRAVAVSLAKGLERATGKTMDRVLAEFLPKDRFGVMGGPMIAEEIASASPTFGILASQSESVYRTVLAMRPAGHFKLYYSKDTAGVAACGVLKNIYAVALGMADCLGMGYNAKAWLAVQAVGEMRLAARHLGGKPETVVGLAGLGDMLATGFSSDSRHFLAGHELVRYGKCALNNEGVVSIPSLWSALKKSQGAMPLLKALNLSLSGRRHPKNYFLDYVSRQKQS